VAPPTVVHLRPEQIERYRRRTLAPREILEIDDHLVVCQMCRRQLLDEARLTRAVVSIQGQVASPAGGESCPSEEALTAYVDGADDDSARATIESHLEAHPACRAEVDDLKAFRLATQTRVPPSARRRAWRWTAAAAALLLLTAGWLASRLRDHGLAQRPQIAGPAETKRPAPRGTTPDAHALDERTEARPPSPPTAALVDEAGAVALRPDGRVQGLAGLSAAEERLLRDVLTRGRVSVPKELAGLLVGSTLRGEARENAFALLSPVGTAVPDDRPTFRWSPRSGTRAYVVAVYDRNFRPVVESPPLADVAWTCTVPLRRDAFYTWRVEARTDDGVVTAPLPPAAEARFQVLGAPRAAEWAALRRRQPSSHLVLGTRAAEWGLLDESEKELAQLVALNPESALAAQLLRSLRAERGGEAAASAAGDRRR
jgi:hypothetical protein